MKIKTYNVSTLSEALVLIKRDLGPKAVILSTRKIPIGSQWWKKKKGGIEVTAAIDYNEDSLSRPSLKSSKPELTKSVSTGPSFEKPLHNDVLKPLQDQVKEIRELLNKLAPNSNFSLDADSIVNHSDESITPADPVLQSSPHLSDDHIHSVCKSLLNQYVDPYLIQDLSNHLSKLTNLHSLQDITEEAISFMLDKIPMPESISEMNLTRSHIISLVGPTGSGKTTTIAKLASLLNLDFKRSVGFISLDYFRLGAHDQLNRYAQILNIPFLVAGSRQELESAIRSFNHLDHILIDTTGRSPNDFSGLSELAQSLQISQPIMRTLVLPANINAHECRHIMNKFSHLQYENLIMSKLDEATSFGNLYNATTISGLPYTQFTMGQGVPEDIEDASRERIIDCLFNLSEQPTQEEKVNMEPQSSNVYNKGELLQ